MPRLPSCCIGHVMSAAPLRQSVTRHKATCMWRRFLIIFSLLTVIQLVTVLCFSYRSASVADLIRIMYSHSCFWSSHWCEPCSEVLTERSGIYFSEPFWLE